MACGGQFVLRCAKMRRGGALPIFRRSARLDHGMQLERSEDGIGDVWGGHYKAVSQTPNLSVS
jgi:hypothetical protein